MQEILVNLKRFDVPRSLGGICPIDDPAEWASWIIAESVNLGLGRLDGVALTFYFPEALLIPAIKKLESFGTDSSGSISVGSQGVFRENIVKGGNFGAFTTNLPATAAKNLGCTSAIIGHSEERKDKFDLLQSYDPLVGTDLANMQTANKTVNTIINNEVLSAYASGLDVLLCVGETAEERGVGDFEAQKPRIQDVLESAARNWLARGEAFFAGA